MKQINIRHLPMILFAIYFLKVSILSVSYPEVMILLVLAGTACFFEFKNADKKLKELEAKVDARSREFEDKIKEHESIKASINGLKLSGILRAK